MEGLWEGVKQFLAPAGCCNTPQGSCLQRHAFPLLEQRPLALFWDAGCASVAVAKLCFWCFPVQP